MDQVQLIHFMPAGCRTDDSVYEVRRVGSTPPKSLIFTAAATAGQAPPCLFASLQGGPDDSIYELFVADTGFFG